MNDTNLQNLNKEEEQDLAAGQALYEMTKSAGWKVVEGWLQDAAFHSWVDPRETNNKEEWQWRELNAFHAANNARELLERVQKAISQSEYLEKIKSGEVSRRRMVI
jgi:hypothetical protein